MLLDIFSSFLKMDGSAYGLSIKLRTTLKRISDNLILSTEQEMVMEASSEDMKVSCLCKPHFDFCEIEEAKCIAKLKDKEIFQHLLIENK
jgi:predicted cupin superfamily sugar epimerase